MVKNILLYIEGGVIPGDNNDVATLDNSNLLRESLYQIFESLGISMVSMEIEMAAGYKNVVKRFLKKKDNSAFLLCDLDAPSDKKDNWFVQLEADPKESIIFSEGQKQRIFFMIQEMEAWILSQPEAIERWGKNQNHIRRKQEYLISDDNLLTGKNAEDIVKPSGVLEIILPRYFYRIVGNGEKKKAKYFKLKTAPSLLNELDTDKLKDTFPDFKRLIETLQEQLN